MRFTFEECAYFAVPAVCVMEDGIAYTYNVDNDGEVCLVKVATGECYTVLGRMSIDYTVYHKYLVTDEMLSGRVLLVLDDHGRGLFTMSDGHKYVVSENDDGKQALYRYDIDNEQELLDWEVDAAGNLLSVILPR